jgi:hypothetical protein
MPPKINELIVKPTLFGSPSLYTLQVFCQIPEVVNVSITYSSIIRKLEVPSWTSPHLGRCLPRPPTSDHPSSGLVIFALSYSGNAKVVHSSRFSGKST